MGPQDNMPVVTQAYAHYAIGPPLVSSSLLELSPLLIYYGVLRCLLFSGFSVFTVYTNGASTICVCTTAPFEAYPWQTFVFHGDHS